MEWKEYEPEFSPKEFVCKCGCGLQNMQESHMQRLITARRKAGIAFKITSGSRCLKHNKAEGGSDTSDHLDGYGTDIQSLTSRDRWTIVFALLYAGFTRIGIGKTFIHAGNHPANAPKVMWLY